VVHGSVPRVALHFYPLSSIAPLFRPICCSDPLRPTDNAGGPLFYEDLPSARARSVEAGSDVRLTLRCARPSSHRGKAIVSVSCDRKKRRGTPPRLIGSVCHQEQCEHEVVGVCQRSRRALVVSRSGAIEARFGEFVAAFAGDAFDRSTVWALGDLPRLRCGWRPEVGGR